MEGGTKKIALVLPVYNRRETTLQGLRSLAAIDASGLDIRTFVVDDASNDGTAEAVESEFPEIVLIRSGGGLHYAAGTNRGVEAALEWEPDFIATMNDDAVFHRDFLQSLVRTAEGNERSVVGSLLLLWDEPHRVFQVGQTWETTAGGWVHPDDITLENAGREPFDVECIVGNCVLFPVDAVRECGLMDERRFPHGWGDAQWLMRMRKAGWRLLVDPNSKVWCEPNSYPAPLHTLGTGGTLRVLFVDEKHPLNLKRQFLARWESAPSKAGAAAAFAVYVVSLFGKSLSGIRKRSSAHP